MSLRIVDQFRSPLMRQRYYLFAWIIRREAKMMSAFAVLEIAAFISVLGMTAVLLVYFSAAPDFLDRIPFLSLLKPDNLLTLGLAVGMGFTRFLAKLLQGVIDARVTSNREAWYAERIRALPASHRVARIPLRELSRGSHYYGRLTGATLHIVASATVFGMTLAGLLVILPWVSRAVLLAVVLMGAPVLALAALRIARGLKASAVGLVERARNTALWKGDRKIGTSEEVLDYYRMYFHRIFLVGVFGHLNASFMALLLMGVLVNEALDLFTLTFGGLFFAFLAAQYYLGALSQFVSNCVKTAAFLPFVEPVFDPLI